MHHILLLILTILTPLSQAVALPAQRITSLNANTDIHQPNLKPSTAPFNLTDASGASVNRMLPCLSLGCARCAAIVFFCAGSCLFAELDLPVCIDCIVGEGESPALEQTCIQCVMRDCMHGVAEPSPNVNAPQLSAGTSGGNDGANRVDVTS